MGFGQYVAARRKALGLSQKDLAARLLKEDDAPISPQYLNDIERDRRNAPSEHLIAQFSRELELDSDYLHVLAGQIPRDVREGNPSQEQVKEAFIAFRRDRRQQQP